MRVVTWNINFSHRAIDEFKEFDWDHRKKYVLESLIKLQTKCTIFHLQEVMPEYLDDLNPLFTNTHDIFMQQVHPCGRCVYSAVPKELSAKPADIPKLSDNHRQVFLGVQLNDGTLLINGHLPMAVKYRMEFSHQLGKLVEYEKKVIVTGDFNPFSDAGGYEQKRIIQCQGGVYELTSYITNESESERVLTTFSPYPYDSVPDGVSPSNLDVIFAKGIGKHNNPKAYPLKLLNFKEEKYGASDHSAIVVDIE